MTKKLILDVTCGAKGIWFQKQEPHTIYSDHRTGDYYLKTVNAGAKHLVIEPDMIADFTKLPFGDESFNLVVFDPPHRDHLNPDSWTWKEYQDLGDDWQKLIHDGFSECMRVLKVGGVLVFKWADISHTTREVIDAIGQEPLFGHRSGTKMKTHWMTFMKFEEASA